MKQILPLIFLLFLIPEGYSQNNPLAKGSIYKIGLTKSGVYKIDGNFLKKKGVDISKINPKNIHIYGNGGGMLPQANAVPRPHGLIENAIEISGENDGKFDSNDHILFFGQSPQTIAYDAEKHTFSHQTNVYSDSTFYFLVINDSAGARIKTATQISMPPDKLIDTYDDYIFHENEFKNIIGKSGREWFGEELNASNNFTLNFDLNLTGILPNSKAVLSTSLVGASFFEKSKFKVFINETLVQNSEASEINDYIYGAKGVLTKKGNSFDFGNSSSQKLKIILEKNLESTRGFLDYWGLQTLRNLELTSEQLQFRSIESQKYNQTKFAIKSTKPGFVWDITNPQLPEIQPNIYQNNQITFLANTNDILHEYLLFTDKSILPPPSFYSINNQDLRSYSSPELLIITTAKFKDAAQKLADHRSAHDGIMTEVVELPEIYNEFSSGKPDVTAIRDFVKFLHDQPGKKLKYLLLFADASYDFRNKDGDPNYQKLLADYVPAYQSRESLDNVKSYSSEDYYGFLENHEGEWTENEADSTNHTLDIGIGRIPVKTVAEANGVVEKLIFYDSNPKTIGNWRTKIALASDDGDSNLHQIDSEDLSEIVKNKINNYSTEKIYVDNYPRISGNVNGKLSPETSKKISNAFKKGALIFNYIGHGGTSNLSDEKILTREDVGHWQNLENMPLMVTATCEFGRYDNPGELSGAEAAILNPNGGAIALLTTTRPVYAITNKKINEAFYNAAFQPINGIMPRLGDILRPTKNNSFEQVYNRNFTLLGDPSMKLAYPEHKIEITFKNGVKITDKPDTLAALQTVELTGEIKEFKDNTLLTDFNGLVNIKVFDKETSQQTQGNNANSKMNFKIFQDKIIETITTVKNGIFKIQFTIPKDIQYNFGNARIEMYAYNNDKSMDALGVNNQFVIGGSMPNTVADTTPPTISAYLNNSNFKMNDTVGPNPILEVNLTDNTGININSSAIGHEILAKLDGKINYVLNEYVRPVLDKTNEINLTFPLFNLSAGKHTLELTAWDIYNNSNTKTLEFSVSDQNIGSLSNVFNFPNPVADFTTVQFDHNFIGENITSKISVLDATGKIVKQFNNFLFDAESPIKINIPAKSGRNFQMTRGVYPYQVEIITEKTNKTASGAGKLIVID